MPTSILGLYEKQDIRCRECEDVIDMAAIGVAAAACGVAHMLLGGHRTGSLLP